jgi:hypothetical protein
MPVIDVAVAHRINQTKEKNSTAKSGDEYKQINIYVRSRCGRVSASGVPVDPDYSPAVATSRGTAQ